MESVKATMMLIVFTDGWYIVNAENLFILAGPFDTHADAEEGVRTRAYRIAKGWAP
jgi:hypothetical protein